VQPWKLALQHLAEADPGRGREPQPPCLAVLLARLRQDHPAAKLAA